MANDPTFDSEFNNPETHSEGLKYPGLAAFLSIIPGLGQIYNGQIGKALLFLFGTTIGIFIFLVPGLLVWAFGIFDSYKTANKMDHGDIPFKKVKISHGAVYFIGIVLIFAGMASGILSPISPSSIISSFGLSYTPVAPLP